MQKKKHSRHLLSFETFYSVAMTMKTEGKMRNDAFSGKCEGQIPPAISGRQSVCGKCNTTNVHVCVSKNAPNGVIYVHMLR